MDDNAHTQMVFEANRKSVGIAYLLWLFLGAFGVHRFYAGATKTGIVQLVLALSVIGWLILLPWLLADLVLIPGIVRDQNMKTIGMLSRSAVQTPPEEPQQPMTVADHKREAMLDDLRSTGYRKERRDMSHLYR